MICEYGCNREAKHQLKNKKWCCSEKFSSCPFYRKKISKIMMGKHLSKETIEKIRIKLRNKFEKIYKKFKEHGFVMLTSKEEFNNNPKEKIECICQKNHIFKTKWLGDVVGIHCPLCAAEKTSIRLRTPFKHIIERTKERGYKLLSISEDYKNQNSKLKFECPICGNIFKMAWLNFDGGQHCPVCARKRSSENNRIPFEITKIRIETYDNRGYKLLTTKDEYKSRPKDKLKVTCKEGHIFRVFWTGKAGFGCQECAKEITRQRMLNGGAAHALSFMSNPSKPQVELFHLVQEVCPYPIMNYPCLNKSIDIAIPKLSIAIEYDGSYWHQDQEADDIRQKLLEEEGWIFLRYRDYVPTKNELTHDILSIGTLTEESQK